MNNSNFAVINYIFFGDSSANNDVVVCKFAFNFFIVLVNNSNYVVINDIDIYFGDGVVMLFNNISSNNDVRWPPRELATVVDRKPRERLP